MVGIFQAGQVSAGAGEALSECSQAPGPPRGPALLHWPSAPRAHCRHGPCYLLRHRLAAARPPRQLLRGQWAVEGGGEGVSEVCRLSGSGCRSSPQLGLQPLLAHTGAGAGRPAGLDSRLATLSSPTAAGAQVRNLMSIPLGLSPSCPPPPGQPSPSQGRKSHPVENSAQRNPIAALHPQWPPGPWQDPVTAPLIPAARSPKPHQARSSPAACGAAWAALGHPSLQSWGLTLPLG